MSIAEIHGKISSSGSNISDRLEDLLTSDVFGTFKYLVDPTALLKFLEKGINLKQETPKLPNPNEVKDNEYHFWPQTANGIPDVIIVLRLKNEERIAIMIEAKYFSGPSDVEIGEENKDITEKSFETTGNQLAKYFKAIWDGQIKKIDIKNTKKFLFYVTCSNVDYNNTLTDACKELYNLEEEGKKRIFWVSWNKATEVLEELLKSVRKDKNQLSSYLLMEDLKELLNKKGLYNFKGFNYILKEYNSFEKDANDLLLKDNIFYQNVGYWNWLTVYENNIWSKVEKIFYKEV